MEKLVDIKEQPLTPEIQEQYRRHIVSVDDANEKLYVQSLGGVVGIGITNYIIKVAENQDSKMPDFVEDMHKTLDIIKEASGVPIFCVDGRYGDFERVEGSDLGVHRGSHANNKDSDCGFADKWVEILRVYSDSDEKNKFTYAAGCIAETAATDLEAFPRGQALIIKLLERGDVGLQVVEHNHAEIAVGINEAAGTTLDTKAVNKRDGRFFNLDIWKVLQKAELLRVDTDDFRNITLGLYKATEKVLVEQQKGIRLPVVINESA